MKAKLSIEWVDGQREPKHPPDPRFPDGMDVDGSAGATRSCATALPYPAKRCGWYYIRCQRCAQTVVITTAGRKDDPRSVRVACKKMLQ